MSWLDDLKKPLYWLVQQDSRAASELGRAFGWDYLRDEGKRNQENPGRAIGKAAASAAAWYLGGAAAGAGGGAGTAAGEGLTSAGMFAGAAPGMAASTEEALAQQALQQALEQQAAQAAATQGMSSSGLFAQVPGVSAGSQQAAMLAAQNEGLGGAAADMTARAAMPAVQDAYASGQMGTGQYLMEGAKNQAAGLNDPRVWLSRLQTNAGRMAGNAGKGMATNMALRAAMPQQPQYHPAAMPAQRQMPDLSAHSGDDDLKTLIQRAEMGDPVAIEKLRKLKQMGVA
jgi:hypothetical protein